MVTINSFHLLEDEEKSLNQLTEVYKSIIKKNAVVTAAKREAKAKKAREKKRNWADMPRDVLSLIFMKLGAIGILYRAQSVCSSWRKLSKDPYLFRSINLCQNEWKFLFQSLQLNINSYEAGHYMKSKNSTGNDEVAVAIADRTPHLLRLHLSGTELTDIGLQALLDGCCYLEILDLGQCVDTNIGKELQEKCIKRIKCFVLPVVGLLPYDVTGGNDYANIAYSFDFCRGLRYPDEDEDLSDNDDDSVFLPKKLATCYL
ncbi:hypothetical protein AQUCO_02000200v1 [Aquilegia coerulea]|uniref:F-box domain-containing protein n=1 Tax=Aquilegia coerulea TaxID=218851 RepID=A0A2G5DGF4_AQUCA|nr:hypothetical protein AQUCO_02000200v1 [Aquilegia coerulea]